MKHVAIALVLCAIPAMAFSQQVVCEACSHDVSVFQGDGGLIAEADGATKVTWVASCGGVTQSGSLTANANGMVSMLFTGDNGLACAAGRNGRLQIGPVKDGGWYWLTDATNSAVGSLVSQDILANDAVKVTNAGPGVSMTTGRGAVFLKEAATGRVGILPTILPEPPAAEALICGPRRLPAANRYLQYQVRTSCMLGDGLTAIRLVGPGNYNTRSLITNGAVTRPTSGVITVNVDLWLVPDGSYSTDTSILGSPSSASMRKGWFGSTIPGLDSDHDTNYLTATFLAVVARGDSPTSVENADAGISITTGTFAGDDAADDGSNSAPAGQATIVIAANNAYCPARGTQHTATINIFATPTAGMNAVSPPIATGRSAGFSSNPVFANMSAAVPLDVVCAPRSSAADEGEDLVPENPFPVSE